MSFPKEHSLPVFLRYKIVIAYDGSSFGGWQTQSNTISIQTVIEKALEILLRQKITVFSAGRTDAGVHAKGQVAHFDAPLADVEWLLRALNGVLPAEIRILSLEAISADFHARYSAISKEYHYHVQTTAAVDPFQRLYVYHCPYPLDIPAMQQGCQILTGTHDFTSFANKASQGSAAKNPIRTVYRLELHLEPRGWRFEFEGDGFLYKMVRNMTGALLAVGKKKIQPDDLVTLLKAKNRRLLSPAAPPQGLFLMKVNYG